MRISDEVKVGTARRVILMKRRDVGGIHCPACERITKEYHRKINAEQARSLIIVVRKVNVGEIFHLRDVLRHGATSGGSKHAAALRWWGLLEPVADERGWWMVTEKGRLFARGVVRVREYVWEFDGEPLEFDGEWVSIREALGNKFDFDQLWRNE